jgi:hypothetical protein
VTAATEDVLRGAYRVFNARDVDAVLAAKSPEGEVVPVVPVPLFVDGLAQRMDVEEPA